MSRRIELSPASLPEIGARALVHVDGRGIALFNLEGVLYAIDDSCPHAGSSLLNGALSGRTVQCRAHGLRFDLVTGCMPGTRFGVRTYRMETFDGRTFLTMPDAAESQC